MIRLSDNLEINKPAPVDDRLGVFVSTASALSSIAEDRRYVGLTVIVDDGTGAEEYWFKDGVADGDLEVKSTGGTQVNSDWNAVSGVAEILNKPTIPTSLPPNGNAGGDLQGTYPDPTVHRVHGVDFQSGTPQGGDVWIYGGSPAKWQHQPLTSSDLPSSIDASKIANGNVSNAEFQYLDGVTSAIQTQLDAKAPIASPTFTGTVSGITKSMVGLGNVDNTSDANKPVSTATQTALNAKENTITAGTTLQYYRGDKTFQTLDKTAVGLGNVDNTSDANKTFSASQITSGTFASARIPKITRPSVFDSTATLAGSTTSETVIKTITIPANTLSVGDVVKLGVLYSFASNTNTKTARIRFGSNTTSGTILFGSASMASTITALSIELWGIVTSSTNMRLISSVNTTTLGAVSGNINNLTIDITTATSFSVTITKTTAGDTATCEMSYVEILTA